MTTSDAEICPVYATLPYQTEALAVKLTMPLLAKGHIPFPVLLLNGCKNIDSINARDVRKMHNEDSRANYRHGRALER